MLDKFIAIAPMKRKSQFSAPYLFPSNGAPEKLERISLVGSGDIYNEAWLRDRLFQYPECLPIDEIDGSFSDLVPICCELSTNAGRIDVLYATPNGRLILLETKLWRNPQARREVIGQILDYAKELKSWSYADLQREVSKATKKAGNSLYGIVAQHCPEKVLDEARFVDETTRNLRNGRFLLLIAGDGIREDAHAIANFLMDAGTLLFTLALVEVAIYKSSIGLLIQPRPIAQTEIIKRIVITPGGFDDDEPSSPSSKPSIEKPSMPFWEDFFRTLKLDDPEQDIPTSAHNNAAKFKFPWTSKVWLTTYTAKSSKDIGVMLRMKDEDGISFYESLEEDYENLSTELGLSADWFEKSDGSFMIIARKTISKDFPPDEQQSAIAYR